MADNLFGIVNITKLLLYIAYEVFFYIITQVITVSKFNRRKKTQAVTNEQIIEANSQTKTYYFRLVLIINVFYYSLALLALKEWYTLNMVMLLLSKIIYLGSLLIMLKISMPKYSDANELIYPGVDLNADHPSSIIEATSVFQMVYLSKDLIILSAAVQVLSLLSIYFWFSWVLVLARLSIPCIHWLVKELLLHDIKW